MVGGVFSFDFVLKRLARRRSPIANKAARMSKRRRPSAQAQSVGVSNFAKPRSYFGTYVILGFVVLTTVITLLADHFRWSDNDRQTDEYAAEIAELEAQHIVDPRPPVERITTHLDGSPAVAAIEEHTNSGFRGTSHTYTIDYWVHFTTKDWVILNGTHGARSCPGLFDDFVETNQLRSGMAPERLDALLLSEEGKDADVDVKVPRFSQAPDLSRCVGYTYDAESMTLKLGSHSVAFLATRGVSLMLPQAAASSASR